MGENDAKVIAENEGEYIFLRQPDGSLRPKHSMYRRQPCATHGDYDAGLDGRCVRCGQKIAPRTVIIIE